MFLKKLSNFFLELFFPKKCLARLADERGCGKNGAYICQSCLDKIEISQNNQCAFCEKITPYGLICKKCKEKHFLDKLIWATPYSGALIKELIKIFKYHHIKELAHPLSQLLIKSLTQCVRLGLTHNALVVAVPLHKQRLRDRDYNQAELLAKNVAEYFSVPLEANVLKKTRFVTPQTKMEDYKARKTNIKNAFEISPEFTKKCVAENKNLLKEKTIVLVDDVFTSGATLSEAAKILKRAGAKEIWGLVIAKG